MLVKNINISNLPDKFSAFLFFCFYVEKRDLFRPSVALRNRTASYKAWLCMVLSSIFKTQLKRGYGLLYIVGKIILCSLQKYCFHLLDFIIRRDLIENNNSIFQLKSNFASFQNISVMRFEWSYNVVYLRIRKR